VAVEEGEADADALGLAVATEPGVAVRVSVKGYAVPTVLLNTER
jgi:hypothetical protein